MELYQALYRKYRPKNFDDVVGQEHITETLKQEIASGRIGHAYLFTGSRGTGKTTCSKIIAKAVKENPALEEKIVPKSAYVAGAYVDAEGVKKLAAIPSREVLLAKMVGCLQAPIANLAYVMNAIAGQKS